MSNENTQDWDVVVLKRTRPYAKKGNTVVVEKRKGDAHVRKLDECDDVERMPKIPVKLRNEIRQARDIKGYTQKQLADLLNVPVTLIQNYENRKALPKGAFIAKLEKVLGCKLSRSYKK